VQGSLPLERGPARCASARAAREGINDAQVYQAYLKLIAKRSMHCILRLPAPHRPSQGGIAARARQTLAVVENHHARWMLRRAHLQKQGAIPIAARAQLADQNGKPPISRLYINNPLRYHSYCSFFHYDQSMHPINPWGLMGCKKSLAVLAATLRGRRPGSCLSRPSATRPAGLLRWMLPVPGPPPRWSLPQPD